MLREANAVKNKKARGVAPSLLVGALRKKSNNGVNKNIMAPPFFANAAGATHGAARKGYSDRRAEINMSLFAQNTSKSGQKSATASILRHSLFMFLGREI
jgi:hypothetical protein